MKSASLKELKAELQQLDNNQLIDVCLKLAKFKKENKELLTYFLYDEANEQGFIEDTKNEIDIQFDELNRSNYYFIRKGISKILRNVKKHIRYSKKKQTEVELLLHFCTKMKNMSPSYTKNVMLTNTFNKQMEMIQKASIKLDEDLQFDYSVELDKLK